jgi:hypothetical protein
VRWLVPVVVAAVAIGGAASCHDESLNCDRNPYLECGRFTPRPETASVTTGAGGSAGEGGSAGGGGASGGAGGGGDGGGGGSAGAGGGL